MKNAFEKENEINEEMNNDKTLTGYASKDRPWLKYYAKGADKATVPSMSIFQFLEYCNKDRLDLPAIELRTSNNDFKKAVAKYTYGEFLETIRECARSLKVLGIKTNDIVPLILPNVPESRILIYATNILGAIPYPISPMLPSNVLKKIIDENNIKNIAVYSGFYDKFVDCFDDNLNSILYLNGLESLPTAIRTLALVKDKLTKENKLSIPNKGNLISGNDFFKLKKFHKENITPYYSQDHIATIIGTSGTTGIPKGVCLLDSSLNAIAVAQMNGGNFDVGEVELDALIQSIAYGFSTMHYSSCGGLTNILIPELITNTFPKILCQIKPDHFTGGPIHYINLVKSEEWQEGKVPKCRNLISGGATLDKQIEKSLNGIVSDNMKDIDEENVVVRQGLGITENGGVGTYAKKGSYKFGGVGIPLVLENMGIFEPGTDHELPYGVEGEICISGPTIMKEYLNNHCETNRVIKRHSDGKDWLHLGDLGKVTEDGQFYITDRIKNIFMRKGFNVHPSKITEYINSLPIVKESIVVGVEHKEEQCVPVAFVILKDEAKKDIKGAQTYLEEACYRNLDETSNPYEWYFVDQLPRNLGGKIDTNELIKKYQVDYINQNSKVLVKDKNSN